MARLGIVAIPVLPRAAGRVAGRVNRIVHAIGDGVGRGILQRTVEPPFRHDAKLISG